MSEDSMTAQITEQLPDLPKEWIWANVGQLYDVIGGGTPSTKVSEYWQGDIPWITSADIHGLKDIRPRKRTNEEGIRNSATNLVPAGSLIVVTRVSLGRIALTNTPISFSQDSQALLGNNDLIYPDYALYFLSQAVQVFKYRHRGTTIAGVTKKQLRELPFALPPISEQHRIVDKIEELFTKLDAGIESLKKAQAQLKQYRQSVLKAAVEGKLTEEWRAAHKDELEPASVLLERIQKERREKWEAEQLESFAARGKTPKDDKWKGKYKEPETQILNDLSKPPMGWTWARLDSVSEALGGYAFRSKDYSEDGFQIVKIGNVKMGRLTLLTKPSFIRDVDELIKEKYLLRRNDIAITLTGTRRKRDYGFAAMIKDEENLLLNQRVARLRFHPGLYSSYFLFALQSEYFRNSFFRNETGNVGQGNVGMKAITQEYILLPPLLEQQKIVKETEYSFSIADEIEVIIKSEIQRANRLRQSILKQSFSGKLVPQDQNDEPASILLERIKAEKAVREADNKRARKSKAKPKK